jgi:1-acyl-sn-glycerol-3-phosphate acyltransferase
VVDRIVWLLSRVLVLPLLAAPPLRLRRRGTEHLPRSGPVSAAHRDDGQVGALPLQAARLVPAARPRVAVRRGSADFVAIGHAMRLLERGECVVVFPEGRVSRSGLMRRGHPGAGMLALRTGAAVVPAVAWDTQLFRGPGRGLRAADRRLRPAAGAEAGPQPGGDRPHHDGPGTDGGGGRRAGPEPPLGAPPPVVPGAPVS